jgi:branched-chain amino acid transport system permease protein
VLVAPGGIAALLDFKSRKPLQSNRAIVPQPTLLDSIIAAKADGNGIMLRGVVLSFGGVRAIDGVDLDIRSGEIHGLIGPNGSGKTTILNVISGYYRPEAGDVTLGAMLLDPGKPESRAARGIARTFQTPRTVGEATVLQNVMIGGTIKGRATFAESLLTLPRHRHDEAMLRQMALLALRAVGLESFADIRADRLQHSELRFIEIARALMSQPSFILLDEPAAGLAADEIRRLGQLIQEIVQRGVGVLLVEHHADLIFDICHQVTVLNLGRVLASGTPAEIRVHKEVVSAYLGG